MFNTLSWIDLLSIWFNLDLHPWVWLLCSLFGDTKSGFHQVLLLIAFSWKNPFILFWLDSNLILNWFSFWLIIIDYGCIFRNILLVRSETVKYFNNYFATVIQTEAINYININIKTNYINININYLTTVT